MGNNQASLLQTTAIPIAAFHHQEKNSLIAVCKNVIEQFDPITGARKSISYIAKSAVVHCAIFIEAEDTIITGDEDGKLRVYQGTTGNFIKIFGEESHEVIPQEEPKDSRASSGSFSSSSNTISLPSISQGMFAVKSLLHISFDRLLAGYADGKIKLFSKRTGQMISRFSASVSHSRPVVPLSMAFDTFRQTIFAGYSDGITRAFNLETGVMINEMRGHFGAVIAVAFAKSADVLVTSSSDQTVRVWNIENGKELCGYKFYAQCLLYDDVRDILFLATNEGTFAIAKVSLNTKTSSAELRILKKSQAHKSYICSIWYSTERDALLSASVDSRIGYWTDITAIPYSEAVKSSPHIISVDEGLTEESIQQLLTELQSQDSVPDAKQLSLISAEKKILDLCVQLVDDDTEDSHKKRKHLIEGFDKFLSSLQKSLSEIYSELNGKKEELVKKYQRALNPEIGRKQLEDKIAKQIEEMKARHEREWKELQTRHELERKTFNEQLPSLQRLVASQIMSLKKKFYQTQNQVEIDTSKVLRRFVTENFPIINNTYQIGAPISRTATSVFKGLDLNNFELVAIKAFPSGITLETSLKHDTLVPITDVCTTEGTVFVVMKMMKENLCTYVHRQPNELVDASRTAQIIYTLLKCLAYLHSNRMVVRDLKPEHILLNDEEQPRLIHLGVMRSLLGTPESEIPEEGRIYSAPEIFGRVVKGSSDIWSLGCIFLYLLQTPEERKVPLFSGEDNKAILQSMVRVVGRPSASELQAMSESCKMAEDGIELLHYISELDDEDAAVTHPLNEQCKNAKKSALDLLSKMLCFLPNKRISAVEALQHPYFQEYGLSPSLSESELHPHTDLTSTFSDTSDNEFDEEEPQSPQAARRTQEVLSEEEQKNMKP